MYHISFSVGKRSSDAIATRWRQRATNNTLTRVVADDLIGRGPRIANMNTPFQFGGQKETRYMLHNVACSGDDDNAFNSIRNGCPESYPIHDVGEGSLVAHTQDIRPRDFLDVNDHVYSFMRTLVHHHQTVELFSFDSRHVNPHRNVTQYVAAKPVGAFCTCFTQVITCQTNHRFL